jgi:hypothetical protein
MKREDFLSISLAISLISTTHQLADGWNTFDSSDLAIVAVFVCI